MSGSGHALQLGRTMAKTVRPTDDEVKLLREAAADFNARYPSALLGALADRLLKTKEVTLLEEVPSQPLPEDPFSLRWSVPSEDYEGLMDVSCLTVSGCTVAATAGDESHSYQLAGPARWIPGDDPKWPLDPSDEAQVSELCEEYFGVGLKYT